MLRTIEAANNSLHRGGTFAREHRPNTGVQPFVRARIAEGRRTTAYSAEGFQLLSGVVVVTASETAITPATCRRR
jgi:hypothetical protein